MHITPRASAHFPSQDKTKQNKKTEENETHGITCESTHTVTAFGVARLLVNKTSSQSFGLAAGEIERDRSEQEKKDVFSAWI